MIISLFSPDNNNNKVVLSTQQQKPQIDKRKKANKKSRIQWIALTFNLYLISKEVRKQLERK